MRDIMANPYSPEEERVAKYINDLAGIGGGDDPVGFLIASHASLIETLKSAKEACDKLESAVDKLIACSVQP